jgi:hypothetical protein
MATYDEFRGMIIDRVPGISDPETAMFVSRLVTYTDDLITAHVTPIAPPVLPDIVADSKGDDLIAATESGGGAGSSTGGTPTIPPPVMPPIVPNSKDM